MVALYVREGNPGSDSARDRASYSSIIVKTLAMVKYIALLLAAKAPVMTELAFLNFLAIHLCDSNGPGKSNVLAIAGADRQSTLFCALHTLLKIASSLTQLLQQQWV